MVCLDGAGDVVRPALLWNDTRSAGAAHDLVAELGGGAPWADAVGVVNGSRLAPTESLFSLWKKLSSCWSKLPSSVRNLPACRRKLIKCGRELTVRLLF